MRTPVSSKSGGGGAALISASLGLSSASPEVPPQPTVTARQAGWTFGLKPLRITGVALALTGALVVLGIVTAIPARRSPDSPYVLATLDGSRTHGVLSTAAISDLNGDGRNDLVVSASEAREIYLLFGGSIPKSGRLASVASVTIRGSENGSYTASGVADLDGDGLRDLLVSVQLREPDTFRATGATYLLRGRRTWPSSLQLPGAADVAFRFTPPKEIGMVACSSTNPIDLNRDGIEDLVLGGADYSPPGRASAGGVFVVFGRRVWPAEIDVERDADFAIHGFRAGEGLTAQCAAGDFNGDGRTDLATLALEHTLWNMLGSRGRYYLFFGRDDWPRVLTSERDADLRIDGERPNALTRQPVLADLNGDGFDDLIVGLSRTTDEQPTAAQIAVFSGGPTPKAVVHPLSEADVIIEGESGAELGASMSAADLDGDGMDDLILTEAGPGRVHVLFGRSRWPVRGGPHSFGASELFRGDHGLGRDRLQIGDLDEDGLPELVLASAAATGDGRENAGRAWLFKTHRPVKLDVRPGHEPNVLYLPGVLVAKVAGGSFAADDPIEPASVRLAGVAPTRTESRDFDQDGRADLLLYFDTREMRVTAATTRVSLTARTRSGRLVAGHDSVTVMAGTADQLSEAAEKSEARAVTRRR
jgi:FG-GAP-like repeat/FG-GAP repeat